MRDVANKSLCGKVSRKSVFLYVSVCMSFEICVQVHPDFNMTNLFPSNLNGVIMRYPDFGAALIKLPPPLPGLIIVRGPKCTSSSCKNSPRIFTTAYSKPLSCCKLFRDKKHLNFSGYSLNQKKKRFLVTFRCQRRKV